MQTFWAFSASLLYLMAAVGCALGAAWIVRAPLTKRLDRLPTIAALSVTGLWAAMSAVAGPQAGTVVVAETLRNLAWLLVLYRLFGHDGRDRGIVGIRPVFVALAFVICLQPALLYLDAVWAITPTLKQATAQTGAILHVLVAVGALVLLHNLYGGASRETRDALRWSAAGLAGFWAFELNYFVFSYLVGTPVPEFVALRGVVAGAMAIPLSLGAINGLAGRKLQASHNVTFRLLSLLIIAAYLAFIVGLAELVSLLGGDLGRFAQVGFLIAAATISLLWLPSQRLRGWIRVTALKHLFQHRYDYREEWVRFTQTIGKSGPGSLTLSQRAAKALADIIQSPGAILFMPDQEGRMVEHSRWNWPGQPDHHAPIPAALAAKLEREDFVIDLMALRSETAVSASDESARLPHDEHGWLLIPLLHFDRSVGAVMLAQPEVPRPLDWEDFDLLKVAARQLASTLAEHESQGALMEAAKFDDFNRRMAFVMHDIKNLASQLQLLSRNAERHADNPAFRKDMLVTLASSAEKLNALLARLGRYGTGQTATLQSVDLVALASGIADRFAAQHKVTLTRTEDCTVLADHDGLEQAVVHLVANAIDASDPQMPVAIEIYRAGVQGKLEIVDSGSGMDAEFVRHRLFKPFVSSKRDGFGIGALEARELVRSMGGRLDVESRPGIGSRFTISIPLAETARLVSPSNSQEAA